MRWLALPLLLALLSPAAAENRTAEIPLHYAQALEVHRILGTWQPEPIRRSPHPEPAAPVVSAGMMPAGIIAWSADPAANSLRFTGSPEALDRLREVIRLLDIRPRTVRLAVRAVRLDPLAEKKLLAEGTLTGGDGLWLGGVEGKQLAELRRLPALAEIEQPVANNFFLGVRLPWRDGEPPAVANLMPRLNGDGSVTLVLDHGGLQRDGRTEGSRFVRRLIPDQGLLVLSERSIVWLVTSEVLPEEKPAAK
ncbi:MAG TPA: secretin N-terminal domain-containing protein [Armatimonadota bacterium]|nr:secretin N-terminal domain-containing protein [Armatimonadota bacterium]